MTYLAVAFFAIALMYALVGFGGGSSYIALMVLFGVPHTAIASISLVCNIIVGTGCVIHFAKSGYLKVRELLPFVIASVPMAYLGGCIPISKKIFLALLGLSLLLVGLILLLETFSRQAKITTEYKRPAPFLAGIVGGLVGLLSGLVGIGGGIILSTFMLYFRWAPPKNVACICAAFILVNSLSGFIGQLTKNGLSPDFSAAWPLFIAVFIGGQLGSMIGSQVFSQVWVKRCTAIIVFYVGLKMLFLN